MHRLNLYIPLFPAAGPSDQGQGRLLALGFERCGTRVCCARAALTGPLGQLLDETRHLLHHPPPGAGPDRPAWGPDWLARRVFPLERLPDLTEVGGAQLGLALGLTLTAATADSRLLAFGRLEPRTDGIGVAPIASLAPLLAVLEQLAPQPRPLLCLIPAPRRWQPDDARRLAALAGHHLQCRLVGTLTDAVQACADAATVRRPGGLTETCS